VPAYVEFCFNLKDLLGGDDEGATSRHIVGFEAVIKPETSKYLHHYTLYAFGDQGYEECPSGVAPQNLYKGETRFGEKKEMVWLWAPGQHSTALPPAAGIRALGPSGMKAVVLQVRSHKYHSLAPINTTHYWCSCYYDCCC
jgi:hypothetical protein